MEFYFPTELGEQLAFGAAAFTALAGFIIMFAPGYAMRLFGMQVREGRRDGYAELRSMGGFYLGTGLAAIMLAQNFTYLALGAAFAMAAFARIISRRGWPGLRSCWRITAPGPRAGRRHRSVWWRCPRPTPAAVICGLVAARPLTSALTRLFSRALLRVGTPPRG